MSTKTKKNVGKFAKGTSGNPTGRPLGSRNRLTLLVEALLGDEAEALTRKLIETALGGDISALRLCIERLAPIRKDRSIELKLSPIQNEQQALDSMNTVVTSIGEGQITPLEGESIVNILAAQTKLFMRAELVREEEESNAGYKLHSGMKPATWPFGAWVRWYASECDANAAQEMEPSA